MERHLFNIEKMGEGWGMVKLKETIVYWHSMKRTKDANQNGHAPTIKAIYINMKGYNKIHALIH